MTGISIYAIISDILADNALRRRLGRSTPGLLTPDNREALAVTARAAAAQTAASAAPYITVVSDDGEIITIDTPESLSDAERGLTARLITHAAGRRTLAGLYAGSDPEMAACYTQSAEASESVMLAMLERAASAGKERAAVIAGRIY